MARRLAPALGLVAALLALAMLPACQRSQKTVAEAPDSAAAARNDSLAVRQLVLDFGNRLRRVSLLAPPAAAVKSIRSEYSPFVFPTLIQEWAGNPKSAPGRLTSSPWPARIEIRSLSRKSPRVFIVDGDIVEQTSWDLIRRKESGRIPVQLAVWKMKRQWFITKYEQGQPAPAEAGRGAQPDETSDSTLTSAGAADVIREYYKAIQAGRYHDAYSMWESDGAASGKSFVEFLNGFVQTKTVEATVGAPGPIGAAAGSRYVDVPVRIEARTWKGTRQHFAGKYTLRRSVVDGATPEQRTWRIYSASIRETAAA